MNHGRVSIITVCINLVNELRRDSFVRMFESVQMSELRQY